ncbi:MAG: hypothetical protein U0821_01925 [Chloroflexota bacterium]
MAVAGIASTAIYAAMFARQWPLAELYAQPFLDYAFLGGLTLSGQLSFVGSFIVLFGIQWLALLYPRWPEDRGDGLLRQIVLWQVAFGIVMAAIYPVAALDVYDYLMYGRISLFYRGNPFTQPPAAFADILAGFSPWPLEPSVYGPVWQLISIAPTALGGADLLTGLWAFKILGLLGYVACSCILALILSGTATSARNRSVMMFAWNPLLQFELVGNAHNDSWMVLFILLAVLAVLRQMYPLALPFLALAMLTKIPAAALGPVVVAAMVHHRAVRWVRLRWLLLGGATSLLLAVVLYAPFWEGASTLHFLTRGNWFTASLPTMLRELLRRYMEFETAGRAAASFTASAFTVYVAWRLWAWWRESRAEPMPAQPTSARWLLALHDVTFVYLAFACIWWEPWYLAWLVALASVVPDHGRRVRAALFSIGGVLNYVVFKYIWPVYQPMTYTEIMAISVLMIFGLPLAHLAWFSGRADDRRGPGGRSTESSAAT